MNDLGDDIENVLRYLNDERLKTGRLEYLHLTHALSVLFTDHTYHKYLCLKLEELDLANYKIDRGYYLVQLTPKSIDIMERYGSLRGYLEESRRIEAINSSTPATKPIHIASVVKRIISGISHFVIKIKNEIIIGVVLLIIEYWCFIPRQEKESTKEPIAKPSNAIITNQPKSKIKQLDSLNRKK